MNQLIIRKCKDANTLNKQGKDIRTIAKAFREVLTDRWTSAERQRKRNGVK